MKIRIVTLKKVLKQKGNQKLQKKSLRPQKKPIQILRRSYWKKKMQ
jgi:hypothetical protein